MVFLQWTAFAAAMIMPFQASAGSSKIRLAGPAPDGWQTEFDIRNEAKLALDMISMTEAATVVDKKKWYEEGGHSDGLTLKSLGTEASTFSGLDPIYNFYVDSFTAIGDKYEENEFGVFDGHPVREYAHAIVEDLFDLNPNDGVAQEAILSLGLWMRVYHYVYDTLRICEDVENGVPDTRAMINNLDLAAAHWIGKKQEFGSDTKGVMLYNLAERTSFHFAQDGRESKINSEMLSLLGQMKVVIEADMCAANIEEDDDLVDDDDDIDDDDDDDDIDDDDMKDDDAVDDDLYESGNGNEGYAEMHGHVIAITKQMNILLVQRFIHYLVTNDNPQYIEMYALALVPQIRACDPVQYEYFMDSAVISQPSTTETIDGVLLHLQGMYSCLGLTCADIGAYSGDRVPVCDDAVVEPSKKIAGYQPQTDVRGYAKIDRDIFQMQILLNQDNFKAAMELYKKGRNIMVDGEYLVSLQDIANDYNMDIKHNDEKRMYVMFENYDGNKEYANEFVHEAFEDDDPKVAVPVLLKAVIAPHYGLKKFFASYEKCIDGKMDIAGAHFDQGVAALVGSIEGEEISGAVDNLGASWFSLAKEFCDEFQCSKTGGTPALNADMMGKIDDAKKNLERGECSGLLEDIGDMESLVFVPIIQGLLYHTSKHCGDNDDSHFTEAEAYANAVIPVVSKVSPVEAHILEQNLFKDMDAPCSDIDVWSAIGRVLNDLGIACEDLDTPRVDTIGGKTFCEFKDGLALTPTAQPVRSPVASSVPSVSPSASPSRSNTEMIINRDLINGRYIFTDMASAENQAHVALDIQKIKSSADTSEARGTYESGMGNPVILGELAINAPLTMENDPYYNFYRFAWKDETLFTHYNNDTNVVDIYADAVISSAFDDAQDVELAAESMVVLVVWMHVVHHLTLAVDSCKNGDIGSDSDIDNAFALYIGVGQEKGKNNGFLLYSLAQKGASFWQTKSSSGEAKANKDIFTLFAKAKAHAQRCGTDDKTEERYEKLRSTVGSIISKMNVPLLQLLEHNLRLMEDDESTEEDHYVELYALAILPQMLVCNPTRYDFFLSDIIESRVDKEDIPSMREMLKNSYDCFGVTCEDVRGSNHDDCQKPAFSLAGFIPDKNVYEFAKIDQDALKVDALFEMGAFETAKEYYEYGDMMSEDRHSLKVLALGIDQTKSPFYSEFQSYYSTTTYAHDLITNALSETPTGDLATIATSERREIIYRTVQTMILFSSGVGAMYRAVESCDASGKYDEVVEHWDRAAAFLIGSIEGDQRGGDDDDNGVGWFGLTKEFCWHYKSCTQSSNAMLNDLIISHLSTGEQLIAEGTSSSGDCSILKDFIDRQVKPLLLVPLIQSTVESEHQERMPSAYTVARSIIPMVNAADNTSAATILSETQLDNNSPDAVAVADAFFSAVAGMMVPCDQIGESRHLDFNFCPDTDDDDDFDDDDADDDGTKLADGLYITTTDVGDRAKIDLDIKGITYELTGGNKVLAKQLYDNGYNYHLKYDNGTFYGFYSFAKMSLEEDMSKETIFNLYKYTLQDSNGKYMGKDVAHYADSIVTYFFNDDTLKGTETALPAEAAVVLNLWAHIVHKLETSVEKCKNSVYVGNEGVQEIDEAVAYWIGSSQAGASEEGHLLYKLTEAASGYHERKDDDSQSRANRRILRLFREAALQLSLSSGCGPSTAKDLRVIVNKITAHMKVPLIQTLIYHLQNNNRNFVKLYAHAVVPLVAGCKKSGFEFLKDKLITSWYVDSDVNTIIFILMESLTCLGLKCEDIGSADNLGCGDRADLRSFASYKPRTNAQEYSDIDIDIRHMELMLEVGADQAAMDIYENGLSAMVPNGNSVAPLTLQHLATFTERRAVPSFELLFKSYYNSENYADTLVHNVINAPENPLAKSREQRVVEIVGALQYLITPMAALAKLFTAAENCYSNDDFIFRTAQNSWDQGAALLIGSFEGDSLTGTKDGYLTHGLAKSLCGVFGTCGPDGNAVLNRNLGDSLFGGAFSISKKACNSAKESAMRIEAMINIPMIQGSLDMAFENDGLNAYTPSGDYAAGYIYTRAVLPVIDEYNKRSAEIIDRNMKMEAGAKPVIDGYKEVFKAFSDAIALMKDVECQDIGYYAPASMGVCSDMRASSASTLDSIPLVAMSSLLTMAVAFLAL